MPADVFTWRELGDGKWEVTNTVEGYKWITYSGTFPEFEAHLARHQAAWDRKMKHEKLARGAVLKARMTAEARERSKGQ